MGHRCAGLHISIHALREEGDAPKNTGSVRPSDFYPRPPRGGRLYRADVPKLGACISIHALREEGDTGSGAASGTWEHFYPRPPRGGRPGASWPLAKPTYFYPRPPRGGRLSPPDDVEMLPKISIHALREEGDLPRGVSSAFPQYFYPRPPRGGRLGPFDASEACDISIHALREEGDFADVVKQRVDFFISIHALREEGDQTDTTLATTLANFSPRPPRGGRRSATRRGRVIHQFLSTPSARRAT